MSAFLPRQAVIGLLGLLSICALCGCNTTARRISQNQGYFDARPQEIQQKIRQGEVELGFEKKDVYLALGAPDAKYTRTTAAGENEVWGYWSYYPASYRQSYLFRSRRYGDPFCDPWYWDHHAVVGRESYERLRLVFESGKVAAIERLNRPW